MMAFPNGKVGQTVCDGIQTQRRGGSNEKHGWFGRFQMPVNILAVTILIANIGIITIDGFSRLFDFVHRSFTISDYFFNRILSFPSLQDFFLARNIQVYLPVFIALILGIYLIVFAHRMFNEKFRHQLTPLVIYMIALPYFSTANWVASIWQEARRTKPKW